jgi:hypothetical protein
MSIDDKLDKLNDKLSIIDTTLVKQQTILDEHVRRTNILEERFEPVEEHVNSLKSIVRFFKFLGVIAAIVEMIYQINHWL